MKAKARKCPYCGDMVIDVPAPKGGGWIKVDARVVYYRRLRPGESVGDVFFTEAGGMVKGFLSEEPGDGRGHRPHYLSCGRSRLSGR